MCVEKKSLSEFEAIIFYWLKKTIQKPSFFANVYVLTKYPTCLNLMLRRVKCCIDFIKNAYILYNIYEG